MLQGTNKDEQVKKWKELGQQWLRGEFDIESWHSGCSTPEPYEENLKKCKVCDKPIYRLNESQKRFISERSRYLLMSGGMGSGKTIILLFKLVLLSLFFPGNRILLGRKTRSILEKVTLPDFFDVCPSSWVEHEKAKGILRFFNGSEIILFGLDALQEGSDQDIKKAEQEIKSLNLGGFFIDQLEEIEESVFTALRTRMRRDVGFRQGCMTTNPANFWAYDYFKANPREGTKLIEVSTLENRENLPEDYVMDLLNNPKGYTDRYVLGEWNLEHLGEKGVFAKEHISRLQIFTKSHLKELNGIKIWEEPDPAKTYQIGVDPSEGKHDPCAIKVVCMETGEEVASFSDFVPISQVVERALDLAHMYGKGKRPLVIPEANASGTAFIELLKLKYDKIFERTSVGRRENMESDKLGFFTNYATKKLLIEQFTEQIKKGYVIIRDKETIQEMRTFTYSDDAKKKGAGAEKGFHDDRIMATMLAYTGIKPLRHREKSIFDMQAQPKKKVSYQFS